MKLPITYDFIFHLDPLDLTDSFKAADLDQMFENQLFKYHMFQIYW